MSHASIVFCTFHYMQMHIPLHADGLKRTSSRGMRLTKTEEVELTVGRRNTGKRCGAGADTRRVLEACSHRTTWQDTGVSLRWAEVGC